MVQNSDHINSLGHGLIPQEHHTIDTVKHNSGHDSDSEYQYSLNTPCANQSQSTDQLMPIYDINHA